MSVDRAGHGTIRPVHPGRPMHVAGVIVLILEGLAILAGLYLVWRWRP